MESHKYAKELDVAVRVVHMACSMCQSVQKGLVSGSSNQVKSKHDDSPVTVADWSVQATVSWILSDSLGSQNVSIIAEEDVQTLSEADSVGLLEMVVTTVNKILAKAPNFGLNGPGQTLEAPQVLEAINRCNSTGGSVGKHWVLDPVDGTLGFVRGDQYAVALALIDDGQVVIGVLGCPNYPTKKESLNNRKKPDGYISLPPDSLEKGCVMYTRRGSGESWMHPLIHGDEKLDWSNLAKRIRVSSIDDPANASLRQRLIEECWNLQNDVRPTFSEVIVRLDKIILTCCKQGWWKDTFKLPWYPFLTECDIVSLDIYKKIVSMKDSGQVINAPRLVLVDR